MAVSDDGTSAAPGPQRVTCRYRRIGSTAGSTGVTLVISNTLTRRKEPFYTIEPGRVRMYVCGPTVYADAHIGHAMSAIVFDVVRRYLEFSGYEVIHAQNFTDVDDKIIQRAAELGIEPRELADELIARWLDETAALNIQPATLYPRATNEGAVVPGLWEARASRHCGAGSGGAYRGGSAQRASNGLRPVEGGQAG